MKNWCWMVVFSCLGLLVILGIVMVMLPFIWEPLGGFLAAHGLFPNLVSHIREWAGWMQAGGAMFGISVAIFAPLVQHQLERRAATEEKRDLAKAGARRLYTEIGFLLRDAEALQTMILEKKSIVIGKTKIQIPPLLNDEYQSLYYVDKEIHKIAAEALAAIDALNAEVNPTVHPELATLIFDETSEEYKKTMTRIDFIVTKLKNLKACPLW